MDYLSNSCIFKRKKHVSEANNHSSWKRYIFEGYKLVSQQLYDIYVYIDIYMLWASQLNLVIDPTPTRTRR